jgi:hypothetical protein
MELENVERLKELIKQRDALLNDLDAIKKQHTIPPQHIVLEWGSGYVIGIDVPFGTFDTIRVFLEDLLTNKLDEVNNYILKL